jgi:type II secretory pathway component PulL
VSRKVLGINIRKESVSAVLVKTSLRESRIDTHAYIPIPDSEEDPDNIQTALEALTSQIDPVGCDCVVSISADHFSYRILKVPFKEVKKIRMVLPFELEPTIPFPVDDLVIDFIDLESDRPGDQTDLIAVAVPKSDLTPYLNNLAAVKIDPEMITLSGLPSALLLARQADPGEDQLFLEINQTISTLFIVGGGRIKLLRSIPTPVAEETRTKALGAFVRRTLAAYGELSRSDFQPLDIVMTGSGLNGADFDRDVAGVLDLPANRLNICNHMQIPIDDEDVNPWDPALMDSALSLAMLEIEGIRGLNFHKGQFAAKKLFLKHKKNWIKTGIFAAAVIVLLLFNLITNSYTLNKQLNFYDQQIRSIFQATFPDQKIVEPFQQMQINVKEAKKNAVVQSGLGPHLRSIDILNAISSSIPETIKVDVTRMVISPETVLISGNTDTFNSVEDIKSNLEQIDFFKRVTISSTNKDRSGKEIRFQLKVEL